MEIIDTHTHIYQPEFDSDLDIIIETAKEKGVLKFLLPNIDLETVGRLHEVCSHFPDICFPMMGLHPTSVGSDYLSELGKIKSFFTQHKYIAVGEIGLDLYWDQSLLKEQQAAFEEQLRWSIDLDLPVVIHSRDAIPQVLESINRIGAERLRGVFHSFGGSREELDAVLRCENFLIGINGVVTFRNSNFRDYLSIAPLERIIVETDAPYLAPVPFRGKRNEPAYIIYTIQKLAEVYQLPVEQIAEQTTENAVQLFRLVRVPRL